MITFDESELCDSLVSDETLRIIVQLFGPKVKDKLLIAKEPDG
jgi:hypothetical protein